MDGEDTVFVVDDDALLREGLALLLNAEGFSVKAYASAKAFLEDYDAHARGCIVLDIAMPEIDGFTLQRILRGRGIRLPIIFLTGQADVPKAVRALKEGAVDFMEKPVLDEEILPRIRAAMAQGARHRVDDQGAMDVQSRYERLTPRQQEVMMLVISGLSNKEVARKLDISTRTAEGHRLRIMEKMHASSLRELIEMARICKTSKRPCIADG